ncbi:M23 family metallopeptidase [Sphingomonas kyeonggiensis]|uniref:Murein DD-endopeptidase MepM/ murein hydrolase activator NlpD n=1 Tax=Sphingomonas kyeonggiensis TaxID=1268553 RepID=A0A7W6NVR9_9SPHN|nr:M23 family metallopeptidase [Sphingomonas kyeonggiensis]MBB4097747.1 murein DD-endopeptidase MepM/ murein hydrolase activator NlpD [Sphingomonas kyeonggiensis]
MLVWAKRIGWGLGVLLVLLAAGFLSLVRITVQPATPLARPVLGAGQSVPAAGGEDPAALIIPVEGVAARQLSDTWGQSRGNGTREHHAIDIMAPRGTPVLAAASGTVEKVFESVNGGHTLYVRTRDGTTIHYYAHLDAWLVAEKAAVRQGEQIATVGNTGSASGAAPHLHFEIKLMQPGEGWWQGQNINPYPLLRNIAQ